MSVLQRLDQFRDWVLYGTINPSPYQAMDNDADIEERLNVLARAAQDFTANRKPVGDWICGCSELLHANETSCWRCGGLRP